MPPKGVRMSQEHRDKITASNRARYQGPPPWRDCTACGETKLAAAFGPRKGRSGPLLRSECIQCEKALAKDYRDRHPEKVKALNHRGAFTRRGISPQLFDEMNTAQAGKCAICGGDNGSRRLFVDHCHATGKVRALLCGKCNTAIGMLDDCPERLQQAIDYLRHHHCGRAWEKKR